MMTADYRRRRNVSLYSLSVSSLRRTTTIHGTTRSILVLLLLANAGSTASGSPDGSVGVVLLEKNDGVCLRDDSNQVSTGDLE
jgi:hypothetical protein